MADEIVSSFSTNYCIARTSLIFGWSFNTSKSFVECLIDDLYRGKYYRGFVDEYRSPIYIKNLGEILLELAEREKLQGLYHICGSERLSRYDFALRLCDCFGFNKKLLKPVSVKDYLFLDKRPKDCSMKNEKAKGILRTTISDIGTGLTHMKKCRDAAMNGKRGSPL